MDLHNTNAWTRRRFLHTGLTMASAAATMPLFLQRSAFAMAAPDGSLTSRPGVPEDRVLVVIQLSGGNDGLNTVVPFGDANYYRVRPQIGIAERDALGLTKGSGLGLHPALAPVMSLYDDGLASIVQGVGYPNPNRSHFASMDIWHSADTSGVGAGWLGRFFDNQCFGSPAADAVADGQAPQDACSGHAGVAIGRTAPMAMEGRTYRPLAFESADLFRWTGNDVHDSLRDPYDRIVHAAEQEMTGQASGGSNASFLMRTALDARVASERIRKAVAGDPLVSYPRTALGRDLAMVGSMIRTGLETRVYYVSMGGYDTHAGQGGTNGNHARLLGQFAEAVKAFYDDLRAQGNDGRVLTLTFSEFGRRVGQNASGGTDHGTAAPVFLFGPMVKPGLHGTHPSLTDLDSGDLKFNLDFRSVYSAVLEDWMKADSRPVLKGTFRPAKVLRA